MEMGCCSIHKYDGRQIGMGWVRSVQIFQARFRGPGETAFTVLGSGYRRVETRSQRSGGQWAVR